jgi:hypothetical protein
MVDHQVDDWLIPQKVTLTVNYRVLIDVSVGKRAYCRNRVLFRLWAYFWLPVEIFKLYLKFLFYGILFTEARLG